MHFELFLALRYLKAKRKQAFISIISIISVVGIMVGVMALIVVISVMNGARDDLMSRILRVEPHIFVGAGNNDLEYFNNYGDTLKTTKNIKGVVAVTPSIDTQVLVNNKGGLLRGLDTGSINDVMNIKSMITEGSLSSLDGLNDGLPGLIIGSEFAKRLRVSVGDEIIVIAPEGRLTPLGRVSNSVKYRVTGLFNSGYYQYDQTISFISLKQAQELLGIDNIINGIEVKISDPDKADIIGKSISEAFGYNFFALDWKANNQELFSAIKIQKYAMFIILIMIVFIGALNIISSLVMVVTEKSREVAILRAMGATQRKIMCIFMLQGLFVGVVGTIGGLISGLGICELIEIIPIDLSSSVYIFDRLPVKVETTDIIMITLSALAIAFLATIYPSRHASRINPVEALRYE
jgi:lipoprotein-releasing system permease protein